MLKVGIIGASGYTGAELARILSLHPEMELVLATSRQYAGKSLATVYPHLQQYRDVIFEDVEPAAMGERVDVVFTAVPHGTAMAAVPVLLAHGVKVVDLSADFRIHDQQTFEKWYCPHTAVALLPEAAYGLCELYRAEVKKARLVANPGCYPTSVLLAVAPLLKNRLIDPATLVVDAKSGASGAGRGAKVGSLYCEVTEGFRAYNIGKHRHTPEIEQEVSFLAGCPVTLSFSPHLLPMSRGILSTIYGVMAAGVTEDDIVSAFDAAYGDEPFVVFRGMDQLPATQEVRGSNRCHIGVVQDRRTGRIVVVSVIDNLVKGAAGQAVQNMNIMCGLPETMGLLQQPLFP